MLTKDIKMESKRLSVPYWKIGDYLGVHENTVLRMLRRDEIDDDMGNKIMTFIRKTGGEDVGE